MTDYFTRVSRGRFSYGDVIPSSGPASFVGSSRPPAEGLGTAQVGTPSLGRTTRWRISQAAMKSTMVSQSGIGYTTSSTAHSIIFMSCLQASQ